MKPFFKYSGGKTRELKYIKDYFPENTKRIVEPFCGSCAVSFNFELPALVSDLDSNVTNLLQVVQDKLQYPKLLHKIHIANITPTKTDENNKHCEKLYYHLRDECFDTTDMVLKAFRFLYLRQMCFSGMSRVNSKTGKSNVPYGWYGYFSTRLDHSHYELLRYEWEIKNQSFIDTMSEVREGDWVFLDPPYYQRNSEYEVNSAAGTSENLHIALFDECVKLKQKNIPFLLVHSDCDLYRDLYKDFKIETKSIFYSQNFKGKGIKNARPGHLYIS